MEDYLSEGVEILQKFVSFKTVNEPEMKTISGIYKSSFG